MRILITGVGGFVGGHLAELLRAEHPEVEVFGLEREHGKADALPSGVTIFQADLDDRASVAGVLDSVGPDRVVHLAGQSSVQHSWTDPGGTLRTNVLGLVHLLDALRQRSVVARVLVVGSAEEYGVVAPGDVPIRETAPLRPTSPYAVSKAAQGLLALQYDAPGGLSILVTRTFPHTGPRRGEAFAESSFARQIAEIEAGRRDPLLRVGNLEAVRDFTDVRDVVRAYWALLERGAPGEAYNVCSGKGVSIREVLQSLIDLSGVCVEVGVDPERLRPSDIPVLVGDPGKLRSATAWEPLVPLAHTLRDLLDDWRFRVRAAAGTPAPPARTGP